IFSSFVSRTWDYALNDELDFVLDQNQPSHINVCFDEPLLDGEVNDWCLEPIEFDRLSKERAFQEKGRHEGLVEHCGSGCLVDNQNREASVLEQFLTRVAHPLVVVGRLNRKDQLKVEKILAHWNCPLYLESLSGLRESPVLREFRLESGEGIFYSTWTKKYFDGIIRIGGIPTLRLWRELETSLRDWPVLSFSDQSFSGLSRIEDSPLSLQELDGLNLARQGEGLGDYGRELLSWDRRRSDQLKNLLNLHLHSEPSLISSLSRLIPEGSLVFLGNSLPIREWELAADYSSRGLQLYSNRGVNGIDGILSSFLGVAQAKRENWVILGDLSTLYDLNAPWALPMAKGLAWRFVVVNNFGGKIFHRMFGEPLFQNRHEISFEGFAELWQLDYYRWHAIPRSLPEMTRGALIELRPDQEASDAFWSEYKMLNEVMNCCS
ncbi:MAG: hypothetical protein KDD35_01525, partial [Bdellovibrionales bacterium]|nr:hypothetical protein [Bdellovibrionales bacterium]